MELNFEYNRNKDIWCLLHKGKSSNNSSKPTKVYEQLTKKFGESPTETQTNLFIDTYFKECNFSADQYIAQYREDWIEIADDYTKRAKNIFGVVLPRKITAYLTINNRNPYSIENDMFYVSVPRETVRKTIMHELWHFYTWYGLGTGQEEFLGAQKYNELKEAITVLLNVECDDLFPEGVQDAGYPQHQELRSEILSLWERDKDIMTLWKSLSS